MHASTTHRRLGSGYRTRVLVKNTLTSQIFTAYNNITNTAKWVPFLQYLDILAVQSGKLQELPQDTLRTRARYTNCR